MAAKVCLDMRRYTKNKPRRDRRADALVEAYVDWRETCARVSDAYGFWASEEGSGGRVAFGLYIAALDEEQQAAEVYAGVLSRAENTPWSEDPAIQPLGTLD